MARPLRVKLDYAGWSVDMFDSDTKIDKLLDAQGWVGFGIYFYLCMRAYGSEGYFYRWGYDDCATTARKMGGGIGSGTVKETVGYCLQIGLFDKGLFERWEILTSKGIQRRYWEVMKKRECKQVISEFWLIGGEADGVICMPFNHSFGTENPSFRTGNPSFGTGNPDFDPIKESKVKESKEEDIKERVRSSGTSRKAPIFPSDSFEIKASEYLRDNILERIPHARVPKDNDELQKWAVHIERMQRLDGLTEDEIRALIKFATTDTFWQTNILSTSKLREKKDTLYAQMKAGRNNKQKENDSGIDFNRLPKGAKGLYEWMKMREEEE